MKIERDGKEYELNDSETRKACKEHFMQLLIPQIKELAYFMSEYEMVIMADEAFENYCFDISLSLSEAAKKTYETSDLMFCRKLKTILNSDICAVDGSPLSTSAVRLLYRVFDAVEKDSQQKLTFIVNDGDNGNTKLIDFKSINPYYNPYWFKSFTPKPLAECDIWKEYGPCIPDGKCIDLAVQVKYSYYYVLNIIDGKVAINVSELEKYFIAK